jgi:hypothetical protein
VGKCVSRRCEMKKADGDGKGMSANGGLA